MIENATQYELTKAQERKFQEALDRLAARPAEDGPIHPRLRDAQRFALESQLADLRADMRQYELRGAGSSVSPQSDHGDRQKSGPPTWQIISSGALGVVIVAALIIVVALPSPTYLQMAIFRSILALAAGGLGALIPGFLEVGSKNWIRVSLAIALFVLVYLLNPPVIIVEEKANAVMTAPNSPE